MRAPPQVKVVEAQQAAREQQSVSVDEVELARLLVGRDTSRHLLVDLRDHPRQHAQIEQPAHALKMGARTAPVTHSAITRAWRGAALPKRPNVTMYMRPHLWRPMSARRRQSGWRQRSQRVLVCLLPAAPALTEVVQSYEAADPKHIGVERGQRHGRTRASVAELLRVRLAHKARDAAEVDDPSDACRGVGTPA
jgi:hypothetical protein